MVVSVGRSQSEICTRHYEPATEDEKAERIAELEAQLAALREKAQMYDAIVRGLTERELDFSYFEHNGRGRYVIDNYPDEDQYIGDTLPAALRAAGLMEEVE
jgi:hypothetical protein